MFLSIVRRDTEHPFSLELEVHEYDVATTVKIKKNPSRPNNKRLVQRILYLTFHYPMS